MKRSSSVERTTNKKPAFRFSETMCTFQDIKQEIVEGKIWNTPNLVMLVRLVLGIAVINFLKDPHGADPLFVIPFVVIMFFLDFLDGALARKLKQQTLFGKTFDPFVDKLLIVYGILSLFKLVEIPTTLSIPFFSTHIIMVAGSVFLMITHRALPAVRSYGAISNVLAVIAAICYWLGLIKIGKKILLLAIVSGYALIIDYARRISWKKGTVHE